MSVSIQIHLYFVTDKVLVTTGNPVGNGQKTEIIDLSKPNQTSIVKSEVLPDSPGPRGPVGGLVEDQAVICGGSINTDELQHCIILGQPNKKIQMIEKRAYASRYIIHTYIPLSTLKYLN